MSVPSGPLMSKQAGDGEMCVQAAHAVFRELTVLFGGVGVAQTVERQRTLGVFISHSLPVADDELLHSLHSDVRGQIVRNQQLAAVPRFGKQETQRHGNPRILNRNRANLATLAFNRDGLFTESLSRGRRVNAETLVQAQSGEPRQSKRAGVMVLVGHKRDGEHLVKFLRAPGAVSPAKGTLFQFDGQFAVVREAILRIVHFVVEEADFRQIRLDRAGGFVSDLQELHVGRKMFAADIRQLLQMVRLRKELAEAFAGFVIPLLRAEAALPIMSRQLDKLGDKRTIDVLRCGRIDRGHRILRETAFEKGYTE